MKVGPFLLILLIPPLLALVVAYYAESFLFKQLESFAKPKRTSFQIPQMVNMPEPTFDRENIKALRRLFKEEEERSFKAPQGVPLPKPAQRQEKQEKPPPSYTLSFVFLGPEGNYAIINGRVFKEGDRVSPDERIVKITKEGVVLEGRWGRRWLYINR